MENIYNNKFQRKLKYHWNVLRNGKNYFVLTSLEDLKKYALGPIIKLRNKEIYLNEKAQKNLSEFVNLLSSASEYENVVTHATIYDVCLNELEADINRIAENKNNIEFDELFNTINVKINQEIDTYTIYSVLIGLKLEDIQEIKLGNSSIILFTEELKGSIVNEQYKLQSKDTQLYGGFIDKYFLGKVCFKHVITGDYEIVKKVSKIISREILNYFRFFICLLSYDYMHENSIKLRMEEEYITNAENFLALPNTSNTPVVSWGVGMQNVTYFPFTRERLKELQDNLFFDDFIKIVGADKKNDLDGVIITAIHWIGEAQNEYDYDLAFLKYWTSIECIFSKGYLKDITENLAKSVSILIE